MPANRKGNPKPSAKADAKAADANTAADEWRPDALVNRLGDATAAEWKQRIDTAVDIVSDARRVGLDKVEPMVQRLLREMSFSLLRELDATEAPLQDITQGILDLRRALNSPPGAGTKANPKLSVRKFEQLHQHVQQVEWLSNNNSGGKGDDKKQETVPQQENSFFVTAPTSIAQAATATAAVVSSARETEGTKEYDTFLDAAGVRKAWCGGRMVVTIDKTRRAPHVALATLAVQEYLQSDGVISSYKVTPRPERKLVVPQLAHGMTQLKKITGGVETVLDVVDVGGEFQYYTTTEVQHEAVLHGLAMVLNISLVLQDPPSPGMLDYEQVRGMLRLALGDTRRTAQLTNMAHAGQAHLRRLQSVNGQFQGAAASIGASPSTLIPVALHDGDDVTLDPLLSDDEIARGGAVATAPPRPTPKQSKAAAKPGAKPAPKPAAKKASRQQARRAREEEEDELPQRTWKERFTHPPPETCRNCWSPNHFVADCDKDHHCSWCGKKGHEYGHCVLRRRR